MTSKRYSFQWQGTNGHGVLLVHGLTGSPAEMKYIAKQLHHKGYSVFVPTMAGHCADEATLTATHYDDWVTSIRAAIQESASQVNELYVAGICVGGTVGLMAAQLEQPHVKAVAIYSPLLNYDGWSVPFYYPWMRRFRHLLIHIPMIRRMSFAEKPPYGIKSARIRKALIGNGAGIEGTLPSFPAASLYENFRLNDALCALLPQVAIPTLLIHAREDDVGHPRNALTLQKLHGGVCEIAWLDDSYHLIHVDQERHTVAQLTADFFARSAHARLAV
jgi:carboxylesterase